MPLLYLAPGEDVGLALTEHYGPLPLGSVVVLPASRWSTAGDFPILSAVISGSPWAPLALLADSPIPEDLPVLVPLLLPGASEYWIKVTPPAATDDFTAADAIRRAVADRPVPDHEAFCCYLRRRLPPNVVDCVAKILVRPASRSERRLLQQSGAFPAHVWAALFEVAQAVAIAVRDAGSEDHAAGSMGMTAAVLSRRIHRVLAANWRTAVGFGCWEAVVEQGLRTAPGARSASPETDHLPALANVWPGM